MGILDGRVAFVSGASRGLGAAIAQRLASEGASVAAMARTLDPDPRQEGCLAQTVASITAAGGRAIAVQADLARAEDRERAIGETVAAWGPIDILVNNAAATFLLPFDTFPEKRFRLMVETQLWAPMHLTQLVLPGMYERGEGWILNISSRAAVHAEGPPFEEVQTRGFSVYGMVKAGLERMTNSLAAEGHPKGLRANALAPWDNVATAGASAHDLVDGMELEEPSVIAEAALVLCSRDITGRTVYSQHFLDELGIAY